MIHKHRPFLFSLAILCGALLASCGTNSLPEAGSPANASANPAGAQETNPAPTQNEAPLPLSSQLLVGTFKLEKNANAVDAAAADALIPLWQEMKALASDETATQADFDSLNEAIKAAMTPAQVQAILAMNLTQHDQYFLMRKLGFTNHAPTLDAGSNSPTPTADPQHQATYQAQRTQRASLPRISLPLLDALIQLLRQKIGSATTAA
jgi:hypothetical protein